MAYFKEQDTTFEPIYDVSLILTGLYKSTLYIAFFKKVSWLSIWALYKVQIAYLPEKHLKFSLIREGKLLAIFKLSDLQLFPPFP